MDELLIVLQDENADEESKDTVARAMRNDIAAEDGVVDARPARTGEAPAAAKGDPVTVGGLLVSLATAGVLTALVELFKAYVLRREGRKVVFKFKDGDREVYYEYTQAETTPEKEAEFFRQVVEALRQRRRPKQQGGGQ